MEYFIKQFLGPDMSHQKSSLHKDMEHVHFSKNIEIIDRFSHLAQIQVHTEETCFRFMGSEKQQSFWFSLRVLHEIVRLEESEDPTHPRCPFQVEAVPLRDM